ncbi:MAG: type II secretion system minor pseudopilin GspI [Methyloprofundus sp.]|nr:type II secretion system minor pseudopilin GspI [Methyloprofundus sp.]MDT8424664.1 type II secretion system minor pseudopilin GspI [Methyloprofundus sp.]
MSTKSHGFTLIEVMIALAVVAIGLLATLNAANQEIRGASLTQDKMTAYWLMQNKMAEIRLESSWPSIKLNNGTDKIFAQTWYWQTDAQKTDNPKIRKVKISLSPVIADISEDPVLQQTIYIGQSE